MLSNTSVPLVIKSDNSPRVTCSQLNEKPCNFHIKLGANRLLIFMELSVIRICILKKMTNNILNIVQDMNRTIIKS